MAEQGRTISFQLSTGGVDKLSNVSETEVGHVLDHSYFLWVGESRSVSNDLAHYWTLADADLAIAIDADFGPLDHFEALLSGRVKECHAVTRVTELRRARRNTPCTG